MNNQKVTLCVNHIDEFGYQSETTFEVDKEWLNKYLEGCHINYNEFITEYTSDDSYDVISSALLDIEHSQLQIDNVIDN